MRPGKIIVVVVSLFLLAGVHLSGALSCTKVVQTKSKDKFSYLANVTFPTPKSFSGQWELDMKTDVPFLFIGGWGITVNEDGSNRTAKFQSQDAVTLKSGQPISFMFRISWAPRRPVPLVQELVWENVQVCSTTVRTNEIRKIKKQQRPLKSFV
ncbi:unnamed protein product [Allacma fusca]|uniref:Uncharacterized protein n=1 Tax=Allacma fusca TaxID=39272 RepID=A0A8J2L9P4_9HEXA|nr:unnamed protein product [Allacma fusca]